MGDAGTHSLEGLTASRRPVDTATVPPPLAKRIAALLLATIFAVVAAGARADDQPPNTFKGHGLTFSYPGSWIEIPATFETQIGTPLWTESIGPTPQVPPPTPADPSQPQPSPTPQPATTHLALVTLAAYHISVATNCEYPQNDPLAAEIESGCDQVTQSFRLGS